MSLGRSALALALLPLAVGCDSGPTKPTATVPPTQSTTTKTAGVAPTTATTTQATHAASGPTTAATDPHRLPVRPGLLAISHDQIMDRIDLPLLLVGAEGNVPVYAAADKASNYGLFVYGGVDEVRRINIAIRDNADPGKIQAESATALAIWLENILDDVDTSNWVLRQMANLRGKKGASATRQSGSCMVRLLWMGERTGYGVSVTPVHKGPEGGISFSDA